jgi:hypothetical protein
VAPSLGDRPGQASLTAEEVTGLRAAGAAEAAA